MPSDSKFFFVVENTIFRVVIVRLQIYRLYSALLFSRIFGGTEGRCAHNGGNSISIGSCIVRHSMGYRDTKRYSVEGRIESEYLYVPSLERVMRSSALETGLYIREAKIRTMEFARIACFLLHLGKTLITIIICTFCRWQNTCVGCRLKAGNKKI